MRKRNSEELVAELRKGAPDVDTCGEIADMLEEYTQLLREEGYGV